MPLVNGDYKHLEWDTAVYQSKDKVAYDELWRDFDIHSDNKARLGLPSRLVAKTFLFRLIFGGSAPAYANDPEFTHVSNSERYWQAAIDKFYEKYVGLAGWHSSLVESVYQNNGRLVTPTGRIFQFPKSYKRGELVFPRTKILNYPVQSLGADLMALARVIACRKVQQACPGSLFVATVHDSLLFDCPAEEVQKVVDILYEVWYNLPSSFEKTFGQVYDLPCRIEVQVGQTWGEMKDRKHSKEIHIAD